MNLDKDFPARWRFGRIEIRAVNAKGLIVGAIIMAFALYGAFAFCRDLLEKMP